MLSKEQLEKIANPGAADIGGTQSPIVTQMAIELLESRAESLSLREQLAELKALPPMAWRNRFTGYLHSNKPGIIDNCYDELFTAAKPAED